MNEADWNSCTDPQAMLTFLRDSGKLTERKARLFAVACGRSVWTLMTDHRSRQAVEVGEQYADGRVGQKALKAARRNAFAASRAPAPGSPCQHDAAAGEHAAVVALDVCMDTRRQGCWEMANATAGCANSLVFRVHGDAAGWADRNAQCRLLREIVGPLPFRPVTVPATVRTSNDGCVVKLATAVYEERSLPSGHLDPQRLAVLTDALEEAEADADLVGHLRQPGAVHVRGCWCVDLLLGKE
jgi:hypothetical protein